MSECNQTDTPQHQESQYDLQELENTLTAIALEIQRFSSSESKAEVFDHEYYSNKCNIKLKNKQIKKLTANLKLACEIAKRVLYQKEEDMETLNNQLKDANSVTTNLNKINNDNLQKIITLTNENDTLKNEINQLNNLIKLGYTELKKIKDISHEEGIPPLLQLKDILYSCGEFYAEVCNGNLSLERKTKQFECKERFLNSKISILQNQLEAITEEVVNLRQQNKKGNKESGNLIKRTNIKNGYSTNHSSGDLKDDTFYESNVLEKSSKSMSRLDFTVHFSLVRDLLSKQSTMLKELQTLSEEIKAVESV